MKKQIIPAVWFQNKQDPAQTRPVRTPAVLAMLQRDLARIAGGVGPREPIITYDSDGHPCDTIE